MKKWMFFSMFLVKYCNYEIEKTLPNCKESVLYYHELTINKETNRLIDQHIDISFI
jgi:hypothetical protein